MDPRYVFVYAAIDVFCIFGSLFILSKISFSVGTEQENRYFRSMALCFLGFVILDLLWILGEGGILPFPRALVSSLKVVSTVLIPLMVFMWFWFAELRFNSHAIRSFKAHMASTIPIAGLIVCYAISFFNGMVFGLDDAGNLVPGPLAGLTGLVDNIYGIAIVAHAVVLFIGEKTPHHRREYLIQSSFILLCTAGGIIDAVVTNTPIMPLTIAFAFVILFASIQEKQIYNDALTGLNNRRRADEYVEDAIAAATAANPFYLFMLDIDEFKKINDTKGHLEGDRALQAVAEGIAKATEEFHGFAARWGGDEFVVAVSTPDASLPPKIQKRIAACVKETTTAACSECALSVTMGVAQCTTPGMKLNDLVAEADANLYQQKNINANQPA